MPKLATAHIDDAELKMKDPAPPEEMEHRRAVASRLQALMDRPITEAEREFWQEFEADLEKERLRFR
jgi:rubrerythrin